jgi:predicted nucleotide-binding protein
MTESKTVLYVEDDIYRNDFTVRTLESKGFKVLTAETVSAAKEAFLHNKIDVAILDIMLPYGDSDEDIIATRGGFHSGLTLGVWIKQNYPSVPFFAVSAVHDMEVMHWFKENSAGMLHKPVSPRHIVDMACSIVAEGYKSAWPRSFIVHGHDEGVKYAFKNFLQNVLRFPEPIILHEQPSLGRTIIEKFEEESDNSDLVFVLMTPDDKVADPGAPDQEKRRARQNVILELGYFLGRFGRRSNRVFLLYKGPLELPSDITGIVYIDISNGVEAAGEIIRREIKGIR